MDKNNDNKSTGLDGLNGESKTEFLRLIWNSTTYQICLAKMVFDDHGAPVDYIILDINPAYEKAFGFVRDQAINKRVTELFPYYAHKWIEKYGEALRLVKNFISVEHIYGLYPWYEVQVFPLGSGDQFITMAQDITRHNEEKKRIENDITSHKIANEALVERVELLNALMDYNPSLIFLKDEFGRYVYLNRTYEQQFVGSKNWYGRTDFDFWSKESAELFRANDQAVLETGRVTQYLEDSKDLDGTRYCWLNYKFPYTDSKNRKYSGGIGIDVTKRILVEEALRKAEELQHYADELKNIMQNSNRQLKLVNNLLDIIRINAGKIKINLTNIDIILMTRTITESIIIFAEQKGIRLSFSSTLGEKIIGIDEEKYERILLNLLSNAIKFTPRGKSIFVMASQKIVKGKCKVCIKVKDQGIGISPDNQQLIFERFGQVDSSLSRQAEGTGIGLSLVKMFVENMGGEITLESMVGKGSTFTVMFPVTKIKEVPKENKFMEINDNRLIQATAMEFSDIY